MYLQYTDVYILCLHFRSYYCFDYLFAFSPWLAPQKPLDNPLQSETMRESVYLVSSGTLLPSTQLSCSGTLSGGVVCSSAGDWPATGAGLPVGGVSCRVEFSDWPAWCVEPRDWLRAVIDGCWRCGGGTGGSVGP